MCLREMRGAVTGFARGAQRIFAPDTRLRMRDRGMQKRRRPRPAISFCADTKHFSACAVMAGALQRDAEIKLGLSVAADRR